ncbi:MAG: DNA repair protein RecN [Janthinobacterium lividum]
MLRLLSIRDFVIVETLDLEFEQGFTVFSGETGAGKSILIDALALVLGGRADPDVVRLGAARAEVSAQFDVGAEVAAWLDAHALDAPTELPNGSDAGIAGTVLLRRVVDAGGRSRAFINGSAATLTQLREMGEMLVDIHGQHAHQQLMRPDKQRELFDAHAQLGAQVAEVTRAWRGWREAGAALDSALRAEQQSQQEREQLSWQIAELEKLAPETGEWETIGAEHRRLSHAASLLDGVGSISAALQDDDGAILSQLGGMVSKLRELAGIDASLNDALAALEPAEIQLQDAAHTLSHYLQRVDLDPQRLAEVDERLQALHGAARRLRLRPEELPAALIERRARLDALDAAADLDALTQAREQAAAVYRNLAKKLSTQRAKAADALSSAVSTGMQQLAMAGGSFEAALVPQEEGGPYGLEQIEFRVAGHAGVPLRALAKVASGGELARISLALAVIAGAAGSVPTLIFDEVDAGIGGAVAEVVGRLLHQLGSIRQVLCVTHLPQVAARGDSHFSVSKQTLPSGQTVSAVVSLERPGRVDEIARMLGGIEITPTTRRHAKEMLTD